MKKIATLFAAMAFAGSANASIYSYDFTATVYDITESVQGAYHHVDSSSLSGELIANGRVIHGRVTYDTSTELDPFYMPHHMWDNNMYSGTINQNTVAADVGTPRTQLESGNTIKINNNTYPDGSDSFSISEYGSLGGAGEGRGIAFTDHTGALLDSAKLSDPMNFSALGSGYFWYSFSKPNSGGYMTAMARIDSLSATPVPEPTTYAMLGAGLALLAWRKKARA
ncbi:PEP-CTERM sorting domain-containing protein [Oxalobacteraceae bacterium]|nr:PEP-CTERM sorting domain-containing protein [Oxalobacteraceae bacterium]